jgi:hypothetical protein
MGRGCSSVLSALSGGGRGPVRLILGFARGQVVAGEAEGR